MLDGLDQHRWRAGEHVHAVLDPDGQQACLVHVGPEPQGARDRGQPSRRAQGRERSWQIPVNGFWQSHRAAAETYSALVAQWASDTRGVRVAWDLYGGAGLFAPALAEVVGPHGRVLTVDTSRAASTAARSALADLPQVEVRNDSVRRVLMVERDGADIAVLDPPRAGAGKAVIGLFAQAGCAG